jgi:hypothetical protein
MNQLRKAVSLSLSSFFIALACSSQIEAKADDGYRSGLPEVVKPNIQCLGCKEENAGNTGTFPPKMNTLYVKQLRHSRNHVVWHFYDGLLYIGSASVTYRQKDSYFNWFINGNYTIKAKIVNDSNKIVILRSRNLNPELLIQKSRFIFDF